ncbi:HEAT repeat domain-containing protein [Pleurocapsa sp. FMAR1]|uniref:HEAT repeat domain-containing protein n=1 Tax=Pleurocapsa sp. FMAR1 TaxID=3040204 RepID=UPI0029C8BDBA|nr:HEAT repeat domain-containing protein [Pleurocapsa sp. FMAR1]
MLEASSFGKSLIVSTIAQIAHHHIAPVNDTLFASLNDKNSEVRKDAIHNLAALHKSISEVNKRLTSMLKDSDREVRQMAEWALIRINLASSPTAQNYINHQDNHGIASSNGTSNHN